MALWIVVCAVQYVVVFAMVTGLTHLATVLHHFINPHRAHHVEAIAQGEKCSPPTITTALRYLQRPKAGPWAG